MCTRALTDPIANGVSRPGHLGCLTIQNSKVFLSGTFFSMRLIYLRSYWPHSSSTCVYVGRGTFGNMWQPLWLHSDREAGDQDNKYHECFNVNTSNGLQRFLVKESWKAMYHLCIFKLTF